MKNIITESFLENLIKSIVRDLVRYDWFLIVGEEKTRLVVYGINSEGDLKNFHAEI